MSQQMLRGTRTTKGQAQVEQKSETFGVATGTEVLVKGGLQRKFNKVAIVGFAPSSCFDVQVLFPAQEYEIWGLNQLYVPFPGIVEHASRWFQIHHRHSYDQTVVRDHSHHEWLSKQTNFPIYMQEREADVPMSVRFPREELIAEFGTYFTNSISWEIALAIYEGFEEIHIYGVDMATDSEYEFERPSVEFFLGWARGAGIKLVLPEKCDLLKTMWLYPFEDTAPFRAKIEARLTELQKRAGEAGVQTQAARDGHMQILGAMDNLRYIKKTWEQSARELATLENRMTTCKYCGGNHDFRVTKCPTEGQ